MDHWTPWNPFGHPDPEYAGHAYFHPSLEGVTTLTAFLVLLLAALSKILQFDFSPLKRGG